MNLRRVHRYTHGQCGVLVQPWGDAAPDIWILCRQGRLGREDGVSRCWLHERQLIKLQSKIIACLTDAERATLWRLTHTAPLIAAA